MRPLLLTAAVGLVAVSAAEWHYSLADAARIYAEVEPAPRILSAGPQTYPADLKARGIQGWVILHFVIAASGSPIAASITVDSTSDPAFVPAATELVTGSRFRPGAIQGRAVPVCVKQRINWETS